MKVSKVPRAQLEQVAREMYEKHYGGEQAPPKVRNAQALVALGEHRPLRFRGHAYRVPPLPWRVGARLLVLSQVIATEGPEQERAVRVARDVLHGLVRSPRRIRRGLAKPRTNPFHDATSDELHPVIEYLLAVPDENVRPAGKATSVDLMAGLLDFCERWPALVNDEGFPVSWEHYQHGLAHLGRVRARDELQAAQAARMAQVPLEGEHGWKSYTRTMRSAGVN